MELFEEFFTELLPEQYEFSGDVVGSDLFLIEGDSLLSLITRDPTLDLGKTGAQILNAVERTEIFLKFLQGCRYQIVFFDDHKYCLYDGHLPTERAAISLFRSSFIRHMQMHFESKIYTFKNAQDRNWQHHFKIFQPSVVLLSLGDYLYSTRAKLVLGAFAVTYLSEERLIAIFENFQVIENKLLTFCFQFQARKDQKLLEILNEKSRIELEKMIKENQSQITDDTVNGIILENISSERKLATTKALQYCFQASSSQFERDLCAAVLLHEIVISNLSISSRCFSTTNCFHQREFAIFISRYMDALSLYVQKLPELAIKDCADIFDGRLFCHLLYMLKIDQGRSYLETKFFEQFQIEAKNILGLTLDSLPLFETQIIEDVPQCPLPAMKPLKFSIPLFDSLPKFELDEKVSNDLDDLLDFGDMNVSTNKDIYHFQKKKVALTGDSKKDQIILKKIRRQDQWFMKYIQKYAASLTGANGKALDKMVIHTGIEKPSQTIEINDKSDKTPPKNIKASKKAPKLSKAELIRLENAKKKATLQEVKSSTFWEQKKAELSKIKNFMRKLGSINHLLKLGKDRDPHTVMEMVLYKIQILLNIWAQNCDDKATKLKNMEVVVQIFVEIVKLYESSSLTMTIKKVLDKVLNVLGLPEVIDSQKKLDSGKEISFPFTIPEVGFKKQSDLLKIPMRSVEFQLEFCGQYMERDMESAPDPRVLFEPDRWQRETLDLIDRDSSVLVVAPTSAGKTFICFYAMEKILRETDDSIIVYVAPTKALVNQIAAEVYARFSKQYPHAGKTIWSIVAGDFSINDSQNCQILITVPSVLENMLLSPAIANSWTPKIKKIIFDEVHCISILKETSTWMHLLMFAPCPIIAISATIGNPEEFQNWLQALQKSHGHKVELILHKFRYSDLRKFIWTPERSKVEKDTIHTIVHGKFSHIHPAAALTTGSGKIAEDVIFEPQDCLKLYNMMKKYENGSFSVSSKLDPNAYFAKKKVIAKFDFLKYERDLKLCFEDWLTRPETNIPGSPPQKVIDSFYDEVSCPLEAFHSGLQQKSISAYSQEAIMEYFLPMLFDMRRENILPGLFFNYDQAFIEKLGEDICTQLSNAEQVWKEESDEWQQKMKTYKKWQAGATRRQKEQEKFELGAKEKTREQMLKNQEDASWLESFDPLEPLQEFSFIYYKSTYGKEEFQDSLKELNDRGSCKPWMIEALKRGIGIHHPALNRRYRSVVEVLFRANVLSVIITTGTLALGINMPCKTSCFVGDDIMINALNFRQAAGRAGRRGFDLLGHVGFFGIRMNKILRLLRSETPSIKVQYSISTTLLLRLFHFYQDSSDKAKSYTINIVKSIISQSEAVYNDKIKRQFDYFLRFQIEYLRRESYIDENGKPSAMSAFVFNLNQTEPCNFVFTALLQRRVFHKICGHPTWTTQEKVQNLLLVLAHIFARVPLTPSQIFREKKNPDIKVSLEPLPKFVLDAIDSYNQSLLKMLYSYSVSYYLDNKEEFDTEMPLCNEFFSSGTHGKNKKINCIDYETRSPFVALSGKNDHYESVKELLETVHMKMLPPGVTIPYIDFDITYNSYLVDFFNRPDEEILTAHNGLLEKDRWYYLNDFYWILKNIKKTLKRIYEYGEIIDMEEDPPKRVAKDTVAASFLDYIIEDDIVVEKKRGLEAKTAIKSSGLILIIFRELFKQFESKFMSIWT